MSVTPTRDDHGKYRLKAKPRGEFERSVRKAEMSPQGHHVALTLLQFAAGKPDCWPSNGALAAETGLSVRQIQRLISGLAKDGVLVIIDDKSLATQRRIVFAAHPHAPAVLSEHGINAPRDDTHVTPECTPRDDKNRRCRDDKSSRCRDDTHVTQISNPLNLKLEERAGAPSLSLSEDAERERGRESVPATQETPGSPQEGRQPEPLSWEGGGSSEAAAAAFRSCEDFARKLAAEKPRGWWTIEPEKSLALHLARDLGGQGLLDEVLRSEAAILASGSWTDMASAIAVLDVSKLATLGTPLTYLTRIAAKFKAGQQRLDPSTASHVEWRRGELREAREQAEFEWREAKTTEALVACIPDAAAMREWLEAVERDRCGNRGEGALDTGFMATLPLVLVWIEGDWDGARNLIQAEVDRNPQVTWSDLWDVLCRWKPLPDQPA